jgi:hypothetical protein
VLAGWTFPGSRPEAFKCRRKRGKSMPRSGPLPGRWLARRLRQRYDAAKESNLPSRGLPGPASFEDLQGPPQTPVPTVAPLSGE